MFRNTNLFASRRLKDLMEFSIKTILEVLSPISTVP